MEKPNAELEITRNEKGKIIGLAYKVYDEGKDGKRAIDFLEIAITALNVEEPEDHSTDVHVDVRFPISEGIE